MKQHILAFSKLLIKLNSDNIVIGGSSALLAHGLILKREPQDLDIVIHEATPSQEAQLELLEGLQIDGETQLQYSGQRSYKFKKNDKIINILLSSERKPENCLVYIFAGINFYVNPIDHIIKAKVSYMRNISESDYVRQKDVLDLLALKNDNFNYE